MKAIAVNGSPGLDRGTTAMVLTSFLEGMTEAGCTTEIIYTSRLKIKPCSCNQMYCWDEKPGECCIKDEMESVYPRLKQVDTLIFATPVYIPLPGDMQNFLNRLCPLIDPQLVFHEGRTRARFHDDVRIKRIALVSVGGWWEKENMDVIVHIIEELAANANVEFAGAALRPHAFMMQQKGQLTEQGTEVLKALKQAGIELTRNGKMNTQTLEAISRPLISEEEYRRRFGQPIN